MRETSKALPIKDIEAQRDALEQTAHDNNNKNNTQYMFE